MNTATSATPHAVAAARVECFTPNAPFEALVGPLTFLGVCFLGRYDVALRDGHGRVAELPIDQLWRIKGLLDRLPPTEAFRLGIFWREWVDDVTRDELAAHERALAAPRGGA